MALSATALRYLEPLLYETRPVEPAALAAAAAAIFLAALLATVAPARQAARTPSAEALRED